MSNTYRLVNPYIKGDFKSKVTAKNSVEAGKKLYKNLSEHFNNNIPKFYFTVYKGSKQGGKYYHFEVTEKKVNDEVNFSLRPYEVKNSSEQVTNFKKILKTLEVDMLKNKKVVVKEENQDLENLNLEDLEDLMIVHQKVMIFTDKLKVLFQ